MGALAGLLQARGHEVRGSDEALYPPMSEQLELMQVPVFVGFSSKNLDWNPDVVVVGNVCPKDHVEALEASRRGYSLHSLPQILGAELIADHHSIVITGTHGKTTTSALIAQILVDADRDPSCFVGGVPISLGRGWRHGHGEEFVVEGDEYDSAFFDKGAKFLHYRPRTAVLTGVELDHVDIFSSLEQVRETFRQFVRLIPQDGVLFVSADSRDAVAIAQSEAKARVETYSVDWDQNSPSAVWQARAIEYHENGRCRFELWRADELFDRYESISVGQHNIANIVAAAAVAHSRGVPQDRIRSSISRFAGVKRRQEIRGVAQGVYVIDDYAHHPKAVAETLTALGKRFPGRRLISIFEPRSASSRRKTFQPDFVEAFVHADVVVIGRLFKPSRIPEEQRLDPERLALDVHQRGTKASYIADVNAIVDYTRDLARSGDVVVVLSSGFFDGLHMKLLRAFGDAVMPATRQDMDGVRAVLRDAAMDPKQAENDEYPSFCVLRNESGIVGCVALEVFGEDAVLRSLAVKQAARGVGYGWTLADTTIAFARLRGVQRIYLLTDSASDFFAAKHGFRIVDSSIVSQEIASSSAFRNRGESAVAMRLDL